MGKLLAVVAGMLAFASLAAGTAEASTDKPEKAEKPTKHKHTSARRAHKPQHHDPVVASAAEHGHSGHAGQSVGQPWSGSLRDATRFPEGDGYVIRRPQRSYGTHTTVAYTEMVIASERAAFPDRHVLAIGDFSQEGGGAISDHHSHQSGRDVDIGLFYLQKPDSYPRSFVHADEDNLDCEATLGLVSRFAATADKDGGVQMMFLDYDVQGLLYHWGLDHGWSESTLDRMFQFGHGRGSLQGLVHHIPGHDNHLHVRFKCASSDAGCE